MQPFSVNGTESALTLCSGASQISWQSSDGQC
jgi:hypothetical protein